MGTTLTANGEPLTSQPVTAREHEWADPARLANDPAMAAETEGLVGCHTLEARRRVGAWRWPPMQRHRAEILPLIVGRRVLDFGGYAGPVGYGATVLDRLGELQGFWDVLGKYDTIVATHTLEHIVDAPCWLACCRHKLDAGGHLVLVVPSWRNAKLRADRWPHHAWTFALSTDVDVQGPNAVFRVTYLDRLVLASGFDVLAGDDDGENIFLLARKAGG